MDVNLAKGLAPVVLFGYNRPKHILKTLDALNKNRLADQTDLHIFLDASKDQNDAQSVNDVFEVCRDFKWVGTKKIIHQREKNHGLAANIINGVTQVVNDYGRVIVLEDDLVTSSGFLKYMNDSLDLYVDQKKVMHVAGYMFPISLKSDNETLFYQVTSCWGWATWADRWKFYNADAKYLLDEIEKRKLKRWFDLENSNVFISQLEANVSGALNTWAIKWQASVNLRGGMSLHPKKSMVRNIGFDSSGKNCGQNTSYLEQALSNKIEVERIPFIFDEDLKKKMIGYYKKPDFTSRIVDKVRSILNSHSINNKPRWHRIKAGPGKGKKLLIAPNQFHGWKEMLSGTFDDFWYFKLGSGDSKPKVVIDIGAHFGYHSICLISLYEEAKIICIEPNPANIKRLSVNATKNNLNQLSIEQVAISNENGEAEFSFSDNVESSQSTGSYLLKIKPPLEKKHYTTFKTAIVKTETIDALCHRLNIKPDLIKIDIEGAEMLAIQGAKQVIELYTPLLCIEAHSPELTEDLLRELDLSYTIEILESDGLRSFLYCSPK